ncbi:MAG: type II toxin-antitoxin system Phd/YefM family antitoxin [Kiritimatiellae bacterium]|nr:type II toxin-antitoxin system Phd/YefM family antitoxin [Kiritimatiellia bacterium]
MKMINVHEAKSKLSAVLAQIESTGETFLICRNGHPVADLVPHKKRSRLRPHPVMRKIRIAYDPTEPLDPEDWPEEEDS